MKFRTLLLGALTIPLAATLAIPASGAASAKPGPPGSLAEGHITADQGRHPCLTATHMRPGSLVAVQPCATQWNALQRWKILKVGQVILVGLQAHPGSCLGAVPQKVNSRYGTFYYGQLYNCGQDVPSREGLLLIYIGAHNGKYHAIKQAHGGKLLSVAHKQNAPNHFARWLPSSGSIPFTQVWEFPPFKRITP